MQVIPNRIVKGFPTSDAVRKRDQMPNYECTSRVATPNLELHAGSWQAAPFAFLRSGFLAYLRLICRPEFEWNLEDRSY